MITEPMDDSVRKYLQQASQFLDDARYLFQNKSLASAIDRTYYAFFWATRAALLQKGIVTKTHRGLLVQFSKEYVKSNIIEKQWYVDLQDAFEARQDTTYQVGKTPTSDEVEEIITRAENFIDCIHEILNLK